jgi:molybdate transport system regulatory protein
VQSITEAQGIATVRLALPDGQMLQSRITLESLQLLGLAPGLPVLALCKATAVTVAPTIVAVGGVNLLRGTVARRAAGGAGLEVALQLNLGQSLVGFADAGSPLRLRAPAMAAVDQNAVVIGLIG